MRNISQVRGHKDSAALRACSRLHYPLLRWISLHIFLKIDELVGQDVGFRDETKVLCSVNLPKFGDLSIHQVLSCHVEAAREVVHLLILVELLVDGLLDWTDTPVKGPLAIVVLVSVNLTLLDVAEPIVLQRIPHYFDIAIVKVEVVPTVLGQVGSDRNRVFIRAEH